MLKCKVHHLASVLCGFLQKADAEMELREQKSYWGQKEMGGGRIGQRELSEGDADVTKFTAIQPAGPGTRLSFEESCVGSNGWGFGPQSSLVIGWGHLEKTGSLGVPEGTDSYKI